MCIKFNFDKNLKFLFINLMAFISVASITTQDNEIIFFKDLSFFISFIISMYCLLVQKKSSTILNKEKVFRTSNEIDNDSKKEIEKIKTYFFIIIILFF